MSKKQIILGLIVLVALAVLVFAGRGQIHFDFNVFRDQVVQADWRRFVLAIAAIYLGYVFRSVRWARFLRHNKKVHLLSLLGAQVIGFTSVALIGRVADLTRPYLISKRTGQPLSSQIAVYIVERLFDAGALATLLTVAILLAPAGSIPHPEIVNKAKYSFLALTAMGALFLLAIRLFVEQVASLSERIFGMISQKAGQAVAHKIRAFHIGLDTMRTLGDFGVAALLSLGMWFLILLAYYETAHAFVASPLLSSMTLAETTLILAFSGGASFFQLPILGWFTQIGLVGEAIHAFFGVVRETAWACGTMLLVTTFLSVLPMGLIWARFEHVSLRKLAMESEQAGELDAEELEHPSLHAE